MQKMTQKHKEWLAKFGDSDDKSKFEFLTVASHTPRVL